MGFGLEEDHGRRRSCKGRSRHIQVLGLISIFPQCMSRKLKLSVLLESNREHLCWLTNLKPIKKNKSVLFCNTACPSYFWKLMWKKAIWKEVQKTSLWRALRTTSRNLAVILHWTRTEKLSQICFSFWYAPRNSDLGRFVYYLAISLT